MKNNTKIAHGTDISNRNVTYQGDNRCGVSWLGKRKQLITFFLRFSAGQTLKAAIVSSKKNDNYQKFELLKSCSNDRMCSNHGQVALVA